MECGFLTPGKKYIQESALAVQANGERGVSCVKQELASVYLAMPLYTRAP